MIVVKLIELLLPQINQRIRFLFSLHWFTGFFVIVCHRWYGTGIVGGNMGIWHRREEWFGLNFTQTPDYTPNSKDRMLVNIIGLTIRVNWSHHGPVICLSAKNEGWEIPFFFTTNGNSCWSTTIPRQIIYLWVPALSGKRSLDQSNLLYQPSNINLCLTSTKSSWLGGCWAAKEKKMWNTIDK